MRHIVRLALIATAVTATASIAVVTFSRKRPPAGGNRAALIDLAELPRRHPPTAQWSGYGTRTSAAVCSAL